jgi:AcrR family transcriptional regulator
MARWEPGTAERLQRAAIALFAAQGFEETTAAQIAQSVGLTERTFFRHFADKREVLFDGQSRLLEAFLRGVAAAPAGASPIEVVGVALRSAASFFPDERRDYARTRQAVIDRNPALQERERHKLAGIATAVADALRARGVDELAATLAAQSGITVFGIAFTRWIREGEERSLAAIGDEVLEGLLSLTAKGAPPGPAR